MVVYIVNPYQDVSLLPSLCASFLKTFEGYTSSTHFRGLESPSDLVLKIIPIEWLASDATVALQTPQEFSQLARDVYDRCPTPTSQASSPYASASLFQLAPCLPKTIDFKLAADPPRTLLQGDIAMHIAYSWSQESEWLSCSMIDGLGSHQWTASYSRGSRDAPWSTFKAVANEIWQTALDVMKVVPGTYRVFVARDRPMAELEIEGKTSRPLRIS
jgi:mediator of RNA polymerase II transcription subunit 13